MINAVNQNQNLNDYSKSNSKTFIPQSIFNQQSVSSDKIPRLRKIKKVKNSFTKRAIIPDDSDSNTSKSKRAKSTSFGDSLIKIQFMKSRDLTQQSEVDRVLSQQRFELEMKQKDQHHEKMKLRHQKSVFKQKESMTMMKMQHEKKMMRLKIELKKTSRKSSE